MAARALARGLGAEEAEQVLAQAIDRMRAAGGIVRERVFLVLALSTLEWRAPGRRPQAIARVRETRAAAGGPDAFVHPRHVRELDAWLAAHDPR